ncbi:hypothetical protein PGB90_000692 [Kerria lacca]
MNRIKGIILGAPGSGKGTISDRIIHNFNIKHISSGDILRSNISNKTELGKTVSCYVAAGKLVPDEIMNRLIQNEMKNHIESWLLDGYPRTITQAVKLVENVEINLVINLIVPFNIIIDRLKNRWIHEPSGRIYNIGFNNPKVPGLDDITQEKLVQREDDKPSVVQERLKTYSSTVKPIIEFFKSKDILETFEGKSSDEIWGKLYPFLCKYIEKK